MRYLVTGSAGFIGFHLSRRLLDEGHSVSGVDGMTSYYDVELKRRRHEILAQRPGFTRNEIMLEDQAVLQEAVAKAAPDVIVHLAAQAGVRYSLENPRAYVSANLVGTFNVLELAREHRVSHLMLASTSSVYGANRTLPFTEEQRTDHPLTLYAATKKATEGMAHCYAHLWDIPTTAFRFFTVYGPWGRPDMALFRFTENALKGKPIEVYNHGNMARDFTYIDDLVEAVMRLANNPPALAPGGGSDEAEAADGAEGEPGASQAGPYRVVNIGNNAPVSLLDFIAAIERATGRPIERINLDMQPGDVPRTWADTRYLEHLTGFRPNTPVEHGVASFVEWYRSYYGV